MGLSVRVYKNVKESTKEEEYCFNAYVIDKDWNHKIKNLRHGFDYTGEICSNTIDYAYSTHNRFREQLIRLIGRDDLLKKDGTINWFKLEKEPQIPFYDLINFADNEGCIDWETNETIYKSFKDFYNKASDFFSDNEYMLSLYFNWHNIFNDAKEEKCVVVFG